MIWKTYWTEGSRYASARSPNLTSASCDLDLDLDLDLVTHKVDYFIYLSRRPLLPICSKIGSFVFKISCSQNW